MSDRYPCQICMSLADTIHSDSFDGIHQKCPRYGEFKLAGTAQTLIRRCDAPARVAAGEPVLVAKAIDDPLRRVPLLARLIPVHFQDRVDDAGKPVQLRPPHRRRPAIPRRHRIAQHLLHRPTVDAEPTARHVMAQTLIDNRQTKAPRRTPPPLATTNKGPSMANFRRRDRTARPTRVEHCAFAGNSSETASAVLARATTRARSRPW